MNFKKLFVGLVLLCSALLIFWRSSPTSSIQNKPHVKLVLDSGQNVTSYDEVSASTALEALTVIAQKNNLEIHKKHYDFGDFVDGIGTFISTADKAWIYHVNGISGDVAADKKILKDNDVVLWRYMKPN
jgi:hypothetical protein